MKVIAKKNRELALINAQNTQNENRAEIITLVVPEEYEDYNKKIVFITPDGAVWDVITNNEYKITNAITKYDKVDFYIWLTKEVDGESIDFRTKTKTLNFYHNEDASDEITDEEIHGVNTVVNLLEEEIEKVENLNIEATKIGDTTTVTITKKDGTTESVEINDGQDGYTPQKGTDYFTQEDIEEIETDVKNDLEENVLVNYSLIAETGAKIELSINTTDYKLKAILKDKNNNIIHTSNVIDLPLETMVVNATYDNLNKAIILTLQNGTTVSTSVADLVSGLVSESQLQTILSNYYTKTEINNLLNNKVDKVQGKELSSNDFTDTLKEKLEGLENYDDTEIKADISHIQDEQTEQNTDIKKLQTENARLKATLPTTGEVTGQDVTLDKTAELEFIKPPLPMGNSEQETNLYNGIIEQGSLINGEPPSSIATNRIRTKDYIEVVPNTTLPISFLGATNYVAVFYTNDKRYKNQTDWANSGADCEISNDVYYMKLIFKKSDGLNITPSELTNLQIGNTPNPDYPQEITNVTGDVEVKVQNKNLFDNILSNGISKSNCTISYDNGEIVLNATGTDAYIGEFRSVGSSYNAMCGQLIKVKPNTKYTVQNTNPLFNKNFINYWNKDKTVTKQVELMGGNSTRTFTTEFNTEYITFRTGYAQTVSGQQYKFNITVIEGDYTSVTIPSYTPHKEQTFPLTLGNIELCKIGDYQDYFYKESNKWYLHKEIGKVVLDGSESLSINTKQKTFARLYYDSSNIMIASNNNAVFCLCDNFNAISYSSILNANLNMIAISNNANRLFINVDYSLIDKTSSSTNSEIISSFKNWLSTHNTEVYYPLVIPTDTEITDTTLISQLEAINNALSYEEQTNISSNTIALFSVEAYQDAKVILAEKGTYSKPSTGIPKTDLASAVQTSLNKADSALQEHQDISGKLDTSKVKNTNSTTAGDVYDVMYINTMLGDIDTILTRLTTGSGV